MRGGDQPCRSVLLLSHCTPGVYEGGFKTWEGGVDLAQYLATVVLDGSGQHAQQRGEQHAQQQGQPQAPQAQQQEQPQQPPQQQGRGDAAAPALALGPGSRVMELVRLARDGCTLVSASGSSCCPPAACPPAACAPAVCEQCTQPRPAAHVATPRRAAARDSPAWWRCGGAQRCTSR